MQTHLHRFQNLLAYQLAFEGSVHAHELAAQFSEDFDPHLCHRLLATSRAVRAHIAAAWGQRRYLESWLEQLCSAHQKATEMQGWIEAAIYAGYLNGDAGQTLYEHYGYVAIAIDQLMAVSGSKDRIRQPQQHSACNGLSRTQPKQNDYATSLAEQ